MKNFNWWSVAAIATMSMALTACGGDNNSAGNASVRLANATLTHPSLDLWVNGSVATSATAADAVGSYVSPSAGVVNVQVHDAASSTALVTTTPSLAGGYHYTLVAYESGGNVETALLNEDYPTPANNTAQIRLYNAAPDAGNLDVYITPSTVSSLAGLTPTFSYSTGVVPLSSALYAESVGSYKVWVTGYGDQSDLRIVVPTVTLASQQIATVILTPAAGGVLLNSSTLIQQGAYSALRNTNVRVRLAAAVTNQASVVASASTSAGTVPINSISASPSFGYYALVPAASAINISVNGSSVGTPVGTLAAGSDYTLFVYGNPSSPTATLLTDDNRLPTDAAATKVRLINGTTGGSGSLTLTANNALVASNINAGGASSYTSVLGSLAAMNLTLSYSTLPGNLLVNNTNILAPGTVFTVLAAGDVTQPAGSVSGPSLIAR